MRRVVSGGRSSGAFTQLAFEVDNLDWIPHRFFRPRARSLTYDTPTKEPGGIVVSTPIGRDAWFKDSEGNLLNLFQRG
jgi:hypothetical protein